LSSCAPCTARGPSGLSLPLQVKDTPCPSSICVRPFPSCFQRSKEYELKGPFLEGYGYSVPIDLAFSRHFFNPCCRPPTSSPFLEHLKVPIYGRDYRPASICKILSFSLTCLVHCNAGYPRSNPESPGIYDAKWLFFRHHQIRYSKSLPRFLLSQHFGTILVSAGASVNRARLCLAGFCVKR